MNVLITGGNGGLGGAATRYFADRGHHVIACDLQAGEPYPNVTWETLDVTSQTSAAVLANKLKEEGMILDRIVHFAGILMVDSLLEAQEAEVKRILDINLLGVFRVNQALLPLLKRGGRILITTSEVAPLAPLPFVGIYNITKTALDSYTQSLRHELNLLGIQVVTIRPGAFATKLESGSISAMERMCEKSRYFGNYAGRFQTLMKKFTGTPKDPAVLAKVVYRAATAAHPRLIYTKNANPGLKLLNLLPLRLQLWIIKLLIQ